MKASLARLTTVLACLAPVLLGHSLKCVCNSDGVIPCDDNGVCEFESEKGTIDEDFPYCAAIRNPNRGDYLACARGGQQGVHRECTAQYIPEDQVTVERCWCNNGDFCNQDLLTPSEEESAEEEEEESQSSSIATPAGPDLGPDLETRISWESAQSTDGPSTSPTPLHDPTTPQADPGSSEVQPVLATHPESNEIKQVTTEDVKDMHSVLQANGHAGLDIQSNGRFGDQEESTQVKYHDTSIDSERGGTPAVNEISASVMTKDSQSGVSDSLRTDYMKPATDEPVRNGAISSGRCEGGNCKMRRGPTSSNDASTVSSCFLRLFLFILPIPVISAFLGI